MAAHWRSRLASERGTPRVTPPADCQVALVYPGSYGVGMSSLGYQMVYRWMNEHPASLAERFFCEGRPALSVENQRPLEGFDVVAFSVAYELEYLEVVRFLLDNRIPVRAPERDPAADPIVVMGGVCLLVNRLPIYDAADVLVLGDGERTVQRLLDAWAANGGDRARSLEAAARIEGVEVTEGARQRFGLDGEVGGRPNEGGGPGAAAPHFAGALESSDACSVIVTPEAEFADRWLVELARGCPYRCRFCFIGHCVRYRPRPVEAVCEMIERGRPLTQRFGLIAGAVGRHPEIDRLCEWCRRQELDVSFSSLRIEDVTPAMLDLLTAGGQRSVTVAPEAGSERLRRHLGKRLADERIVEFAAGAVGRGLTDLRLYFMVGLPTEELDDVEAIARLTESVRRAAVSARRAGGGPVGLSVNASIFIPKPGTPFGQSDTPPIPEIRRRLGRLKRLLGRMEGVEFRMPSTALAEAQRRLAWGGRETLDRLIEAARAGRAWRAVLTRAAGAGFDEA